MDNIQKLTECQVQIPKQNESKNHAIIIFLEGFNHFFAEFKFIKF
jgi:hypothetical protein